jgi:hypothetical protein
VSGWLVSSLAANLLLVSLWLSECFAARGWEAAAKSADEESARLRRQILEEGAA